MSKMCLIQRKRARQAPIIVIYKLSKCQNEEGELATKILAASQGLSIVPLDSTLVKYKSIFLSLEIHSLPSIMSLSSSPKNILVFIFLSEK